MQCNVEKARMNLRLKGGLIMMLSFYMAAFVYSPVGVPHIHQEEAIHQGDSCEDVPATLRSFTLGVKESAHINSILPNPRKNVTCAMLLCPARSLRECLSIAV